MSFHFDEELVNFFTQGGCTILAIKLAEKIPDSIIYSLFFAENGEYDIPAHWLIRLPTGLFVDIEGVSTSEQIFHMWKYHPDKEPNQELILKPSGPNLDVTDEYLNDVYVDEKIADSTAEVIIWLLDKRGCL